MRRGRPGSVHSIEKAARILRALAEGGPQRLSDLSRRLRMPKTTLIAFVRTLAAERFVVVDGLGRYGLGPGLLELGQAFLDRVTLRDVARPYLERLAEATREVVHLTILSEGEMIYIDRIQTRSVVQVGSRIGGRAPFHCTGVGKAYVAFLAEDDIESLIREYGLKKYTRTTITNPRRLLRELALTRRRRYAIDNSEHDPEVKCVGAPIFDHTGTVCASISVAGPAYRMTPQAIARIAPHVVETARAISRALGCGRTPLDPEDAAEGRGPSARAGQKEKAHVVGSPQ